MPSAGTRPKRSLFLSNLNDSVTETDLRHLLDRDGGLLNCRVCRDPVTKKTLGYGFANYANEAYGKTRFLLIYTATFTSETGNEQARHRGP